MSKKLLAKQLLLSLLFILSHTVRFLLGLINLTIVFLLQNYKPEQVDLT